MGNLLLKEIEYKYEKTPWGIWRHYVDSETGKAYHEFKSQATVWGLPLFHFTSGICPETGHRTIAKGIFAVGRLAMGIVAIGHASLGIFAIGQLGIGVLLGLGQATTGAVAIGQLAGGLLLGLGQLASGYVTVAQLGVGKYVLAQAGLGAHVLSQASADPVASEFFRPLISFVTGR